jgi:secondary thiamine-phosphate synthase enzyme
MIFSETILLSSKGEGDIIDISGRTRDTLNKSGIKNGLCNVFVTGSTAAVTTIEYEPGVLSDLSKALSVLAPSAIKYAHNERWGDGNGRSHVKAALVGPSLTVPVQKGALLLGTWQQIVILELDIHPRSDRTVVLTVIGE